MSLFHKHEHIEETHEVGTAADVEKLGDDVYIFDADGCWTYVKTHEAYCGPYFFQW